LRRNMGEQQIANENYHAGRLHLLTVSILLHSLHTIHAVSSL